MIRKFLIRRKIFNFDTSSLDRKWWQKIICFLSIGYWYKEPTITSATFSFQDFKQVLNPLIKTCLKCHKKYHTLRGIKICPACFAKELEKMDKGGEK